MTDLQRPIWIHAKAAGFVAIVALAGLQLWLARPDWTTLALCALIAWASARFYYYAFYVLERYVGPTQRCRGLADALTWCWRRRRR